MTYQSTLYVIALFIGLITNGVLIVSVALRRPIRVRRLLLSLMVMMFVLSFTYLLMQIGQNEAITYFWANLRYLCSDVMAVLFLLFVLDLSGMIRILRPHMIVAVCAIPAFTLLALLTNNAHHLFITSWQFETVEGLTVVRTSLGDLGVLHTLYALLLTSVSLYFVIRGLIRSRGLARQQYILLLVSALCVIVPFVAFVVLRWTYFDLTPIGVSLSALFVWFALSRRHMLHMLPLAHSLIFDSIADAVFVIDEHQRIVELNRAALQLTQSKYADTIGEPLSTVLPALTAQWKARGNPAEITLEVGNSSRFYEVNCSAVQTSSGLQMGSIIALREITERKIAEARALELALERERIQVFSRFIRSVSHDLRTPLSVMNTTIYVARKTNSAEQREEKLAIIEDQIKRMTAMIEDMHLLAKLDSGIALEMKAVRLHDIIHNIPRQIQHLLQEKHLNFQLEGSDALHVCGQADLLLRAYHNLLHNAVLYTPAEGSVKVRAYANADGYGVVELEDTGCGMTPEQLAAVFEQFQKANEARTTDGSGFGIGLPIVRKIATAHRGTLEATSTPGLGSVFRLVLPLA